MVSKVSRLIELKSNILKASVSVGTGSSAEAEDFLMADIFLSTKSR